jgi:hypothetical protein
MRIQEVYGSGEYSLDDDVTDYGTYNSLLAAKLKAMFEKENDRANNEAEMDTVARLVQ